MKLVFKILCFFFSISIFGQSTLENIFLNIPLTYIENSEKEFRKVLISKFHEKQPVYLLSGYEGCFFSLDDLTKRAHSSKKQSKIYFKDFLPSNGYLSLNEVCINCETGLIVTICYWNLANGSKLVCKKEMIQECCGPFDDELEFYEYQQNGNLKIVDSYNVLPKLDISDVINITAVEKNNLDINNIKPFFLKPLEKFYKLPKKGTNIEFPISFFEDYLTTDQLEVFNKFKDFYFNKIIYVWNGNSFEIKSI